ncbi:hypothetical protein TREES_T100018590 [Tupaia chinensis]|uniref:Uncharacterized protein n=1 Tax=Tupaia chinensis TaxID=246437 RepID=L9KP80_TUPCH|nr:hypothetical protein TREES_T100018590 [Tupaia chinensis]
MGTGSEKGGGSYWEPKRGLGVSESPNWILCGRKGREGERPGSLRIAQGGGKARDPPRNRGTWRGLQPAWARREQPDSRCLLRLSSLTGDPLRFQGEFTGLSFPVHSKGGFLIPPAGGPG